MLSTCFPVVSVIDFFSSRLLVFTDLVETVFAETFEKQVLLGRDVQVHLTEQ